ncbi:MAG: ATP-binding protein [Bacteroidales bacterium]|nr:ATP-binding protein [Bacteroidales bacterium]
MSTLVDNGLKFTEKGEVSFGYKYIGQDNKIEFFVKDTGIGIRKEMQSKIFTTFMQDEKTLERQHGGIGVGLSICNCYIQMLGGSISIESEPQKGSLFHFAIGYNTQPIEN